MAGCEIDSVYVGIAGGHINSLNSHGIIAVKGTEIEQKDVDRVIEAAKAIAIPLDREVIHVLPQEYIVDNQDGIKNPSVWMECVLKQKYISSQQRLPPPEHCQMRKQSGSNCFGYRFRATRFQRVGLITR